MKRRELGKILATGLLSLGVVAPAHAQVATVYGSLGNFDVVNNTGHDAHGFEIELEGISSDKVWGTYTYQRYGSPSMTNTPTGVILRWESQKEPTSGSYSQTTIAHSPSSGFAGTCYMGGVNYNTSGCEHFGVHLSANAIKSSYRWLIEDPAAPGTLIASTPSVPVAAPSYVILPPIQVGEMPELEADVEAPEPAEAPELYGDAQWMKIFKTQLNRPVALDELLTGNEIVPQDAAHVEVEWDIIQDEPAAGGNGKRKRKQNGSILEPGTRAVIRRYELYQFTGSYDPVTHEALCADLACTAPGEGERGDFISAQMAAANLEVNSLNLTLAGTGLGTIQSEDKLLACGAKCVASYNANSQVTLSVKPNSKSTFAGWTGACTGTSTTCVVNVNGQTNVGANFNLTPVSGGGTGGGTGGTSKVLQVKVAGGKGVVTSAPAGIDCGKTCQMSVPSGTQVRLSALAEAGFRFVNWSGACTGAATTCDVLVTSAASVQANFTK